MPKRIAWLILLLLPVCLGLAWLWLLYSESGLQWTAGRARAALAPEVTLGAVEGRLAGPLAVTGLSVTAPVLQLETGRIELDWRPWQLLSGKLAVTRLHIATAAIVISETDGAGEPFEMPAQIDLPVRVAISDADISAIALDAPGLQNALIIDRLRFNGRADARGFTLQELEIAGPDLNLSGRAALEPAWPYRLQVELDWRLSLDGWPRTTGMTRLDGSLQALHVEQALRGPFELDFDGTLEDAATNPRWHGRLNLRELRPADYFPEVPARRAGAQLELDGTATTVNARGKLQAQVPEFGTLNAELDAGYADSSLTVRQLMLHATALPTRLHAAGELKLIEPFAFTLGGEWTQLAWGDTPLSAQGDFRLEGDTRTLTARFNAAPPGATARNLHGSGVLRLADAAAHIAAELQWEALHWPLNEERRLLSRRGTATLTGTADDYRLNAEAFLSATDIPEAVVHVAAGGNREGMRINELAANWLDGTLRGSAELHWQQLRWQAALRAEHINPATIAPGWQGALNAELKATGRSQDGEQRINIALEQLSGQLRDQPVAGAGGVEWRSSAIAVRQLHLALGTATFETDGTLDALQWRIQVPDLALLVPDAAGSMRSSGTLRGGWQQPVTEFSLTGSELRWQDHSLAAITVNGRLSADRELDTRLRVRLSELSRPALNIRAAHAALDGKLDEHLINLTLASSEGDASIELRGGYGAGVWNGELARADFSLSGLGQWTLAAPVALRAGPGNLHLAQACWLQTPASICAGAQWDTGRAWQAQLALTQLHLADIGHWLPRGLNYQGRFDGRVTAGGAPDGALHADAALQLDAGRVTQVMESETVVLLAFRSGTFSARLADDRLRTTLDFALEDGGSLRFNGGVAPLLADVPRSERRVTARLEADTNDFALIPALVPELGSFTGRLQADLNLSGTLTDPVLKGYARFENGATTLPRLGLHLTDVRVTARGLANGIALDGGAQSGEGRVDWQLQLERENAQWRGAGGVQGGNFLALNTPEARVYLAPDLQIRLHERRIDVNGSLRVPRADITPRDLRGTVQASRDQVIVDGEVPADEDDKWRIHARVRTILGDAVRFSGFGLQARVTGEVLAIETPDQLTLGQGELGIVDGRYQAYGQELVIERGRLIYNSVPVTEPALDITATRTIQEIRVGVNIRGTLREPRLSLFSDPPMQETQTLSYLVLGRPINEASDADRQVLSSAAASLGGTLIARAIGRRFGIEDVAVENVEDPESASLVLGKYLSPRLYVSYGIGLFDAANTLRLRYRISSKWTLEAESGEYSSADFQYTIERGD